MEMERIWFRKYSIKNKNWLYLILLILVFQVVSGCLPERTGKSGFDQDGMMNIKGKRTFVLGLYQRPVQHDSFDSLAKRGFNLLNLPADSRLLDSAKTAGISGWVTIGTLDTAQRVNSWHQIHDKIENLKNHPSLLAWELADEPAFTWNSNKLRIDPGVMKETHDSVVKLDPNHPVYLNHAPVNLAGTMRLYNSSNEITACDIYPVIPYGIRQMYALNPDGRQGDLTNSSLSQVGEYVDKMRKVCNQRPLLMVLQGFAWEMLRPSRERDSTKILYPSYHDSWFMAWDAIIHGANGLIWWGTEYTPAGHPFHKDLAQVVKRLSTLNEILSLPDQTNKLIINYAEMGHSINKGIEVLFKQQEDTTWIFTANTEQYPVKAELNYSFPGKDAEVLFEDRALEIRGNTITEYYKPFDVHLYKLTQKH
jgi:hypothetical protein